MGKLHPNFIVGIGGSAGGLNAYKALLDALPSNTGMAFVIVSHILPTSHSLFLDCHDAAQAGVPRLPNFTHSPSAYRREDFVGAEFGAGGESHCFSKDVQLRTTLNGVGVGFSAAGVINRNLSPSGATSHPPKP